MVQIVTHSRAVDSLGLANELRPVLLRLARQVRRESNEFGVTAGQATLLASISDHPGITGRELAEREGVSAPGMSASLDRLEAAALVVRTRAADRRRVGITLSPEGERVLRSIRRQRTVWLAERLERLGDEERRAVEAAIGPLARLLEEESL
jgi:DNA-binding MarR family transcriptional regulator